MYAIIEQGSRQYKVSQGDTINIDLLDVADDAKTVELDKVLMICDGEKTTFGTPYIDGAKVVAVLNTRDGSAVVKGPKLYPTYHRRRKNSRKRIGHRQKHLQVVIDAIEA